MSENNSPFNTDHNDDSLPDLFDDSLSEENTYREEDDIFDDGKKERRTRNILLSSGLALALATGGVIAFWDPISTSLGIGSTEQREGEAYEQNPDGKSDAEILQDDIDLFNELVAEENEGLIDESYFLESGNEFPIDTEDWEVQDRSSQDLNEIREDLMTRAAETYVLEESLTLPQEAAGFTSDDSKSELDGGLNPLYSYWTAEVFQRETTDIIHRLINPIYGEWELYQFSDYKANTHFGMDRLEDIFTERWISEHSGKPYSEYVPVYADWNANDYGLSDKLLNTGNRWVGQIQNVSSEFTYDDNANQYVVDMTVDVKYSAWTIDQETLERKGKLELTFVSNAEDANSASDYKVLVDKASHTVDGG